MKVIWKKTTIKLVTIIVSIILLSLVSLEVINKNNVLDKSMKNEDIKTFSYQIYNNNDNNNLKILLNIERENGIEYIKEPNGTIIYGYGKNKIALDYNYTLGNEDIFIIKEKDGEEAQEKLQLSESGNLDAPLSITNAEQLQNIQNLYSELFLDISKEKIYYKLAANIDLSGVDWEPIGTKTNPFSGILDGNGYSINNFNIDKDEGDVGLFRYVSGTLQNIKMDNATVTGKNNVGALVGTLTGTLTGNNIKATINGEDSVGGIVGYSKGTLDKNVTNVTVNGTTNAGGLVGVAENSVTNNTTNGKVISTEDNTGGVIGSGDKVKEIIGNISNVETTGINNVGGILGNYINTTSEKRIQINSNETKGKTTGNDCVGGIVGNIYKARGKIYLQNNKTKGDIGGETYVGGIVGKFLTGHGSNVSTYAYVQNSYSSGNIIASGDYVGGLIGYQYVIGGGQGGYGEIHIDNSYSTGNISSTGDDIGGLIGYAISVGTGSSMSGTGKLYINNCFSTSFVNGNENIGGIVGELVRYANSKGPGSSYINVEKIYTAGMVSGKNNVEPIFGNFSETVTNKGKLIVTDTYWVPEKTGLASSSYGTSKKLTNMFSASEFSTFDFEDIWKIDEGRSMPYLKDLDKPESVNK